MNTKHHAEDTAPNINNRMETTGMGGGADQQFLGGKGEPLFISNLVLLLRICMHVKGVK